MTQSKHVDDSMARQFAWALRVVSICERMGLQPVDLTNSGGWFVIGVEGRAFYDLADIFEALVDRIERLEDLTAGLGGE